MHVDGVTTSQPSTPSDLRTAVVIVHGVGERRPMETLEIFTRTALRPRVVEGVPRWDYHYPRPATITDTYEARRYAAPPIGDLGHTEILEYHWSYLMTGHRYAGAGPAMLRLFLRRPRNVPDPLFGLCRAVWAVLFVIVLAIPALVLAGYVLDTDTPGWLIGVIVSAAVLLFWLGLVRVVMGALFNGVMSPFVAIVRYLDASPDSYAARRAIRGGLVDLLRALHDGRYSRVVVVGHGVGAYICYDALMSFWAETHALPATDAQTPAPVELAALDDLEAAADRFGADGALDEFHNRQFALGKDLRRQGNPWRITDFITVGASMALADLVVTRPGLFSGCMKSDGARRRETFDALVRRGALVRCPPRPENLPVESEERAPASYRWHTGDVRDVLGSHSAFAVTRWTNLWFPVVRGELRGDWFGGPLRPLFGPGIRDIEVRGNEPERFTRGWAHTAYFTHPDKDDEGDAAWHLRNALDLETHAVPVARLLTSPTDPRNERPRAG